MDIERCDEGKVICRNPDAALNRPRGQEDDFPAKTLRSGVTISR